ncbi:hypothetical protein L2E82_25330 [Cichorium intybus]|uniref:Uncharacterized protein n=1 Tax=Cichorium intybus TaxID=13427 RepID=A0ACB9E4A9_CICIN|nr:hypothetical protein L2E82_25330 [Cichorium intybus]
MWGLCLMGLHLSQLEKKENPTPSQLAKICCGFDEAVLTMKKGEIALFTLPPELGFGVAGIAGVPPKSIIELEIQLVSWMTVVDVYKDGGFLKRVVKKGEQTGQPGDLDEVKVRYVVMLPDGVIITESPKEGVEFYLKDDGFGESVTSLSKCYNLIPPNSVLHISLELVSFKPVRQIFGCWMFIQISFRQLRTLRNLPGKELYELKIVGTLCVAAMDPSRTFSGSVLQSGSNLERVSVIFFPKFVLRPILYAVKSGNVDGLGGVKGLIISEAKNNLPDEPPQLYFSYLFHFSGCNSSIQEPAKALEKQKLEEEVMLLQSRLSELSFGFGQTRYSQIDDRGNGDTTSIANLHEHVGLQKKLSLLKLEDSNVRLHAVKVVANLADGEATEQQILVTGIKVADLLAPYQRGGKIGLFGGEKPTSESKYAMVYGQMNEPLGARARVGFIGLIVAEQFRDTEGQDVLLFIENIFRFSQGYIPPDWACMAGMTAPCSFPLNL